MSSISQYRDRKNGSQIAQLAEYRRCEFSGSGLCVCGMCISVYDSAVYATLGEPVEGEWQTFSTSKP
jgi:hypothetical protein